MTNIFPEVRDVSNLGARFSSPLFLPIAVEGQADASGTASVGTVYTVNTPADADTYFGPTSSLSALVKFLLSRGVYPILAVASAKGATAPLLTDRQAAWQTLESMPSVRIRMTDDVAQATLVALAASCDNANLIYNKQIGFGGMAAGTSKATLIAAAEAINSKRFVLVGPGVYDQSGILQSGNYAAAVVAAEVAKNSDISDDLDLMLIPGLTGIELGANGQPVFNQRVVTGSAVNDFSDLLAAGASPLMTDRNGAGLRISHLRMTYTGASPGTDTTFDALETRLIVDQIFVDVRDYIVNNRFLRRGNTPDTRADLQAGIEALLAARSNWIAPVTQQDGSTGYSVSVIASSDLRSVTVRYEGTVQRNIQVVNVDAELTIPV